MTDAAATAPLRRKLTTIFCADVQGYSRLVELDEVATVARLKQHRAVMTAEIERHHGRVINTWGDGLLAEFGSPVEAVFAAVEAQRRLATLNAGETAAPPMQFRIGINLGDVMIDGDDLYGDGVNIAARLESLADPGGVCISGTVFDQVRKKLDIGFSFLGPREIKNIAEPVPAYRVLLDQPAGATVAMEPPAAALAGAPADATKDIAARLLAWRRLLWRFGVIMVFLIIINLATNPTHIWFFWPMLGMGLLLALRYPSEAFPEGLRRRRGE